MKRPTKRRIDTWWEMLNVGAREELDRQKWVECLRNNPSDELLIVVAGILVQEGYAYDAEHLIRFRGRRTLQDVGLLLGMYDAEWSVLVDTLNLIAFWWAGIDEDSLEPDWWDYYLGKADETIANAIYIDGDLGSFFRNRHGMKTAHDIRILVENGADLFSEGMVKQLVRRA